jgi:uncharacterized protein YkwD
MKVGIRLFLSLAFLALIGTEDIQAQAQGPKIQTLGVDTLSRFDISENTLPLKFDLAVSETEGTITCIPMESDTPVCTNNTTPLCIPVIKENEGEAKAIIAQNLIPQPTIAEVAEVNSTPEAEITPIPTMIPLQDKYAPADAVLDTGKIFGLVNQYRASLGLPPFEQVEKVCELAQTRSSEIIAEIGNGTLHSGLYNRPLPYWIFENAKYGSNEEGTVAWWLASPIHHHSIVSDYKYSCVRCTGSYCTQLFTSFSPKQTAYVEQ